MVPQRPEVAYSGREGRASARKRHTAAGRYKGPIGIERWAGFGVSADNLIDIGSVMEQAGAVTIPRHHRNFRPAGAPDLALPGAIGHDAEITNFAPERSLS
jgi:hypothetical protein